MQKLQALALAKRLSVHGLDKVYSSPMGRAIETAMPTCDLLGLSLNIEEWTREVDDRFTLIMPDGSPKFAMNVSNVDLRNEKNFSLGDMWHKSDIFSSINALEDFNKICDSSDEFLSRHGSERDGGLYKITKANNDKIAVFCHGGLAILWLSHLLNIPVGTMISGIGISHTGVTVIEFANNENGYTAPYCLCLSDISHIYKENLPLKFTNYIDI